MTDHPDAPDPQRRGLLKKAAVGVTVAWVAPTIVSASAGGQQTSGQGTGGGLVLEFRCGDGVTFVVTIPAQYVNAGYYLAPAIDSDLDANYCDDPPTLLGIGTATMEIGFPGFGSTGTGTVTIHNGDCIPIATASGEFDCGPN